MEKYNRSVAPSQPAKGQSFRKNSPRIINHSVKETGDGILNLTFKTATRDDVGKLEGWVHYQLAQVHNTKIATSPDQVLANTFEQISILDTAHDKLASMIGFHCNQKEELVRRIWSSSADLYNRVYSELSVTINELKFKLMDKTAHASKLEELLEVANLYRPSAVVATGPDTTSSVSVYEMSLHRQLEEELILKNKELMAMQNTFTDLSVWFPEFTRYGHSVLKRYLPPVTSSSTLAPDKSVDDGSSVVNQAGDLDLAQHFLLRDLKRLEEIGIGFQIVEDSDHTVAAPVGATQQSQPPNSNTNKHRSILNRKRGMEVNVGSFSAATENEYNLMHDNPSALAKKDKKFFPSEGGAPRTPTKQDACDSPATAVRKVVMQLVPPSPKPKAPAVEVNTGDYYQVQSKRFSMGPGMSFADAALQAASEKQRLEKESENENNLRIDYEEKYRRLLLDAQQLEADIAALLDGNAREAAMHKKEVATLNAQVSVLSGQLETTSTQVTRMAEKLPILMFPSIIRQQVYGAHQYSDLQSQLLDFQQPAPSHKALNMMAVEGLIGKCLQNFTIVSPSDLQSLLGFDLHQYDTYFNLLSGQHTQLGPCASSIGAISGTSTMAHHLFHYLSRSGGNCASALEKVLCVTRAVEEAVREHSLRKEAVYDSDDETNKPTATSQPTIQCSPSLLRMLTELLQLQSLIYNAQNQPSDQTPSSHLLEEASQSVVLDAVRAPFSPGPQQLVLRDVMRFDVLVACFKALKNHFTAPVRVSSSDPRCENIPPGGRVLLCGYSSFPVQLTPTIVKRIFSRPIGSALIGGGSGSTGDHDFSSAVWWHFLSPPLLERVIFEVEMSSLSHGDGSQAPVVNCYDCILLCWKAVYSLHQQLTAILADLYKFLLSVVPQGPASRSFHLLLTHMISLPHARQNDLDAISQTSSHAMPGSQPGSSQSPRIVVHDAPTLPPPVIHIELSAELMALDARGALNGDSFADLMLRSLPACLMINFAHLLPLPPAVSVTTLPHSRQHSVKVEKKEVLDREVTMAELTAAGQVLTRKLKAILSEHHTSGAKNTPTSMLKAQHDKHIQHIQHKAALHSKHNGSRESYFKQSVLIHQLLYPKDVKPTVSSDPLVAHKSATILTRFIDQMHLQDAEKEHYSSTERLLMHARLCFEDEFVKVLAPSREQVTFTVLALKYQVSVLRRLLDCKRSVKSRFNRSNFGNITNDFLGAVIDSDDTTSSATDSVESRKGPGRLHVLDEFDTFERVENHYVWRVKRRVFQAWAKIVSE